MSPSGASSAIVVLALLLVQILFGFNYTASKIIVNEFPPLMWGALRMLTCSLLMFVVALGVVPKKDRVMGKAFFYPILIFSIFGISLNQAFFLMGIKYTTTTNSAILNTLVPVFTLLFALVAKKERWTWWRGVGFFLALLGVLALRRIEDFSISSETFRGDFFTVLNCISLAFFFTASKSFLQKHSAFWVTAWLFWFGSIFLLILSLPEWYTFTGVEHWSPELVGAMVYNVVAATMVTYFLNAWTLKRTHSSSVALFIYMQPVIAILTEWGLHAVVPSTRTLISMAFVFTGVGIETLKKDT